MFLCLIKQAPHQEDIWSRRTAPSFLTLALGRGKWSASCPSHITHRERAPGAHWIGGWMGPSTGLDAVEKRRISCPCWEANPSSPAHSPLLY
jgi:hypothetical protein